MATPPHRYAEYRPSILNETSPEDARVLAELRARPDVEVADLRPGLRAELARIAARSGHVPVDETGRWVYYPWRRRLVALLAAPDFHAVRLDRNRNKLTVTEQQRLRTLSIGVVGQSVGHAVAYALALEGVCGRLRLADFDDIELSNLNRIPATVFDIGLNKAVVAARRIAELDPYLPVEIFEAGVDESTVDEFVDGLSVLVEECDSLDIKVLVRESARRHRIPVLMDTSDRGLLDIERFDLEPDRLPLHGLLGDVSAADLRGLTSRDKAPYVVRILDPTEISARMGASMAEVDRTMLSWPQLGSEVLAGSGNVVHAVRRIGLGGKLPSGRVRIDVEQALDGTAEPAGLAAPEALDTVAAEPAADTPPDRVLACAQRAPSGGNVQPWSLRLADGELTVELDPALSVTMDVGYRGSAVAVGAALYNARVAAAAHGLLGAHRLVTTAGAPLTATLRFGVGDDPDLAADYPGALLRETNRQPGTGEDLRPGALAELAAAAAAEGGGVRALTGRAEIAAAAELLAESDRIRYLTPLLHEQMFAEMRWPEDDLRTGIDVRSLELAPDEQAALELSKRSDILAELRAWGAGTALGDYTRDRMASAAAILAVTVEIPAPTGDTESDLIGYARAGAAVQRLWIAAGRLGLAVQPMSPVFLYARRPSELTAISPDFAATLASLQWRFNDLLGVPEHETMALVLRLSYTAAAASVRSLRRPRLWHHGS
ncbi:Rv1355c family protein [Nocardia sp. alder85J]|uniref:Rv1355c family protein n=1 Tax=Nocardia sp. alder85J TaxID=2862949 RepID=UPI001CD2EDC7|nr:Rv1355c family protein [Nocardia sp. alder85J]MCX4097149.1 Rv1355c family protein [Nocardia sp. alder85J]